MWITRKLKFLIKMKKKINIRNYFSQWKIIYWSKNNNPKFLFFRRVTTQCCQFCYKNCKISIIYFCLHAFWYFKIKYKSHYNHMLDIKNNSGQNYNYYFRCDTFTEWINCLSIVLFCNSIESWDWSKMVLCFSTRLFCCYTNGTIIIE